MEQYSRDWWNSAFGYCLRLYRLYTFSSMSMSRFRKTTFFLGRFLCLQKR